ncbi:MAG: AAA family ATPase [Candidatus Cloacimonadota bacterium]|nr:MAG: AAA family ATPase [Candidatus Cloacimonadota bacterium]
MDSQMSIFDKPLSDLNKIPLAEKARPSELDLILGQDKVIRDGSLLQVMIETDNYSSFILWGPPGCGKTTVASLIRQKTKLRFVSFSAVLSGIKEVKAVMKEADFMLKTTGEPTLVFIDEIHRFNKSQQDAFLPFVESGAVILVGATTENPSFEVIPALLSRCHVFVFNKLSDESLIKIIENAVKNTGLKLKLNNEIIRFIAEKAGGDGRKALNNLDMISRHLTEEAEPDLSEVAEILSHETMFYDKNGEEHYNLISALQKSVRGSDPQAAIYWLARMLESGENPVYIVRRLVRMASEDIGLADPQAIVQATAIKDAVHFLGMPEANVLLTQLTVYLATAPKSNATETAYLKAAESVKRTSHLPVPLHIRNAPTKLMKNLGCGKNYAYSHNFENHYYYQKRFPDMMEEETYYRPSKFGFEKEIKKRLDWWESLKRKQLEREEE